MAVTVPDIAPYWWFIGGMVLLLVFFLIIRPRGFRPYPGPRPYPFPGGGLLGPGGTRRLLGAEGFAGAITRFTMFGTDWCPHCTAAKPIFESMGSTTTIAGQEVALRVVNPEKDKAAATGFEIDGYPTFYLEKDGQKIKYSGPRSVDGFRQFLQQQLGGSA
jgi:thiol-disulfide isomerase/thioredoxin